MGFWFAKRGAYHSKYHLTLSFVEQFPTTADSYLFCGKWSLISSFDYENGRLFTAAIAYNFGLLPEHQTVKMLIIKPFVVYNVVKLFN